MVAMKFADARVMLLEGLNLLRPLLLEGRRRGNVISATTEPEPIHALNFFYFFLRTS